MVAFFDSLIVWVLVGFLGMFGVYLLARLISFAILKSRDDINKHKQKEKKDGSSDKG
jgi:phosphate/sulfate permease